MALHNVFGAAAEAAGEFDTRLKNRQSAKIKKLQGQEEIKRLQHREELGSVETEVQVLNQNNKAMLTELRKAKIFSAFDSYTADSNPRHLNAVLKENPELRAKLGMPNNPVASVSKLDPVNDALMIEKSHHDVFPDDFSEENQDLAKASSDRFLKTTLADGTQVVTDMNQIYQGSGYAQKLNDEELDNLLKTANIEKLRTGKPEKKIEFEKRAILVAEARRAATAGTASPEQLEMIKQQDTKLAGVVSGQENLAKETKDNMLARIGGDEGWQALNLAKREDRLKVEDDIQAMERFGKLQLSEGADKVLRDARKLITFAVPVAGEEQQLTAKETGLVDEFLFGLHKYTDGEVTRSDIRGITAAAGYNSFRNYMLKVMSGTAVTASEEGRFNKAFGTLRQKFPQVMSQFGNMLRGLKSDLDSIRSQNNTYVSEFRMGGDIEHVDSLINNIDTTLENIVRENIKPPTKEGTKEETRAEKVQRIKDSAKFGKK